MYSWLNCWKERHHLPPPWSRNRSFTAPKKLSLPTNMTIIIIFMTIISLLIFFLQLYYLNSTHTVFLPVFCFFFILIWLESHIILFGFCCSTLCPWDSSKLVCVATFIFIALWYLTVLGWTTFRTLPQLLISWWTFGLFGLLATMENAAVSTLMCVSWLKCVHISAGSQGEHRGCFCRGCLVVFPNGCTI